MLRMLVTKLKTANPQNQVSLILADISRLPLRSSTFNLVVCLHVLKFVHDWKRAVQDAKYVMKPGGVYLAGSVENAHYKSKLGQRYEELSERYGPRLPNRVLRGLLRDGVWVFLGKVMMHLGLAPRFNYDALKRYMEVDLKAQWVEREDATWTQTIDISDTLRALDKKSLTFQSSIPNGTHQKIMSELKDWAAGNFDDTHALEEVQRNAFIVMGQFN